MEKFYLYVHDEKAYGHLSRMIKIYHTLLPYYDVCILLGGTLEIHDTKIKYIKLPDATEFQSITESEIAIEKNLKNRRIFIKNILEKDSRFSVLLDYFPFGRHAFFKEIDMIIDISKMTGGKVYSVMRDIYRGELFVSRDNYSQIISDLKEYFHPRDLEEILFMDKKRLFSYPGNQGNTDMMIEILLDYYLRTKKIDALLIFGDENVYDFKSESPLSSQNKDGFIHLGYLLGNQNKVLIQNGKSPYILISVGGNIFDMKKYLSLLLSCSKMKNIRFKIIIGSMVDTEISSQIKEKFEYDNMEFIDFSKNIDVLMQGAKVFIGAGGYGTCMDLIQYNIPAFLYLNYNTVVYVNEKEQYTRIKLLSQYIDITYVESFDSIIIEKIIMTYFQGIKKEKNILNTSGGDNLLKFLGKKN